MQNVAIAGVGGFAADHHRAILRLEAEGLCRVVATCDPDEHLIGMRSKEWEFARRGVSVYPDLSSLLEIHSSCLDVLTLPTPLPLHAEHHRMAIEAGVACYLEKPPSLWWPEFQSMLNTEQKAVKETQVGFNFIGDPMRQELKRRILSGEFGGLRQVRFRATWPRDAAYYNRNDWAGRLRRGDQQVNDSVIGNAMAHYLQNLLFWCGGSVFEVGAVQEVRAWLARTRPIESFDTALVEAVVGEGVLLRIAATHAVDQPNFDVETLIFDDREIIFPRWDTASIGARSPFADQAELLRHNFRETLDYVCGRRDRPTTRLRDAEPFVALHTLAMMSPIADIDVLPDFDGFVSSGRWPAETPRTTTPEELR